jgi:cysteine-S-conjugate beta-lyase
MTDFDFSRDIERRGTNSIKWTLYGEDVLPMWVADTEFAAPVAVIDAIRARLEHPVFGYQADSPALRETIAARMLARYGWDVDPSWILLMPGLVAGLNIVTRAVGEAGDGVLMTPPIYPPFMYAPRNFARVIQNAPLTYRSQGHILDYAMDFDALEAAVTPNTKLFLFCNPHNPAGRVFSRAELEQVAAFCERHDLILCSDEIHSDLTYSGQQHIPIASLSSEIANRTITLIAPSKTFNIPGLGNAAVIIPDKSLRDKLRMMGYHLGAIPSALGFVAAEAAYREGDAWLMALMAHLEANRDFLVTYVNTQMPGVKTTSPQATYLAWLDFRELSIENPHQYFLERAKVALSNGADFGAEGQGFARLNFGCSRTMLTEALERMRLALAAG